MDIAAAEAKERFETLMEEVARGHSVTITDDGRPVARLVPAMGAGMVEATGPRFVMPPFDREIAGKSAKGLLAASRGLSLGGLTIRELIEEGRAPS